MEKLLQFCKEFLPDENSLSPSSYLNLNIHLLNQLRIMAMYSRTTSMTIDYGVSEAWGNTSQREMLISQTVDTLSNV